MLFNLVEDSQENFNVAREHPEVMARMLEFLERGRADLER
jgi:hypothetical protein